MTEITYTPPIATLLSESKAREQLREQLAKRQVCVIRNVIAADELRQMVKYLAGIGRGSLPNWQPILPKCPNFHRVNQWDERSYVKACFHQFSFFPWNQDIFNFFTRFREIFFLRNILANAPQEMYLGSEPDDECIARLSFQFYPKGIGAMNMHRDPEGPHQAVVPILVMSERGRDFKEGGVFVQSEEGERIFVEDHAKPGDVILFDPRMLHGVATIDPNAAPDWQSFEGRWMSIFAVNKLATNTRIAEAIDVQAGQ